MGIRLMGEREGCEKGGRAVERRERDSETERNRDKREGKKEGGSRIKN